MWVRLTPMEEVSKEGSIVCNQEKTKICSNHSQDMLHEKNSQKYDAHVVKDNHDHQIVVQYRWAFHNISAY
jgi:hypothetical protein